MTLSDALHLFLEARSAEGKADSTLVWYERRLKRFVNWCDDAELSGVEVWQVRGFLASLRGQAVKWENHPSKPPAQGGLSPATIRGYARALRQFANFLYSEGLVEVNIMEEVKLPKKGKAVPKAIAWSDVQRLLDACAASEFPERDRALVLFLADTACRVGGLVSLTLGDLEITRRRALVVEKGSKARWVFFTAVTREALKDWLAVREKWVCSGPWVFLSAKGGALTASGVNQLLNRLAGRAGVEGRVNPHSFRHGFAKMYLQRGGDLATLADLMGHESVETTKDFYAIFQTDELARQHQQFSPVGGLEG